ncbi:MAG: hypothetical protein KF760_34510 [Candidatus Eremiobacteraeota bacterium]|nr:hypothetical protein [Candidatus Eremiobacteraeota bacterium]MCW5868717.1 hypothetical protein [Candidatus Eremiobacteraeota bacterium]
MIQLKLALLILVDGGLAGFRSGAGRNPRIYLVPYYRECIQRAILLAGLLILAFSALSTGCPDWADLLAAGARMLSVLSKFAWVGLAALSIYLWNIHETTVLATILLLGPMTLIRPWVIAVSGAYALYGAKHPFTITFTVLACLSMLAFERLLELGHPPWRRLP